MISKTFVDGKILKKYKVPIDEVNELNTIYESEKNKLGSKGSKLAGRIDSELDVTTFIDQNLLWRLITLIFLINQLQI